MKRLGPVVALALASTLHAGPAPWFSLESTGGATRTPASYRGRVVLLMYEDRDSTDVNSALKAHVRDRVTREKLDGRLAVVPIADLRAFNLWFARPVARAAVIDEARALGMEILLDWDGAVRRAFSFQTPGSNVALLGRDGTLLYQRNAMLDADERRRFDSILTQALATEAP